MDFEGWVQSTSAAAGAAVVVGTVARRYWSSRELRQQAAFRAAVAQIVNEKAAELLTRQTELLTKTREHLDRQDRAIAELRRSVEQLRARPNRR